MSNALFDVSNGWLITEKMADISHISAFQIYSPAGRISSWYAALKTRKQPRRYAKIL